MKDQYYFGRTLAKEIDFFAYSRVGSHYFRYCTQGLFDLVALRTPGAGNPEAISRQQELNPNVLYALDLREDGVPAQPVVFHTRVNSQHGLPVKRDHRTIVLIREPVASVYSYYRAALDRWGLLKPGADHSNWVRNKLRGWHEFYAETLSLMQAHPGEVLLVRYESLLVGPEELERVVEFVGVRPKLRPAFVHEITRFETMIRPGERTFFRGGNNTAWREHRGFCEMLARAEMADPAPMGYALPPEALRESIST